MVNIFPVDIDKSRNVGARKKLINREKQKDFRDIDADKLTLRGVNIPNDEDETLQTLVLKDDTIRSIWKLRPILNISKVLPDEPIDEHIHVIVEWSVGMCCLYNISRKYYLVLLTWI